MGLGTANQSTLFHHSIASLLFKFVYDIYSMMQLGERKAATNWTLFDKPEQRIQLIFKHSY